MHLSDRNTNTPPSAKPMAAGTNAYFPSFPYVPDSSAISIPGAINDQKEAAVITWKFIEYINKICIKVSKIFSQADENHHSRKSRFRDYCSRISKRKLKGIKRPLLLISSGTANFIKVNKSLSMKNLHDSYLLLALY